MAFRSAARQIRSTANCGRSCGPTVPEYASAQLGREGCESDDEVDALDQQMRGHWRRLDSSRSPRQPRSARSRSSTPSGPARRRTPSPARPKEAAARPLTPEVGFGEAMLGLYLDARERGSGEAEAIQSVASGCDEDASTVLETLIEHVRSLATEALRRKGRT